MQVTPIDNFIDSLKELIYQAGEAILNVYSLKDFDFTYKEDKSPLTLADKISHKILTEGLQKILNLPTI